MKNLIQIALCIGLLMNSQPAKAQIFKKIKEAVTAKEHKPTVPGEKISGSELQFEGWDLGEVYIVAIICFTCSFTFALLTIKFLGE